MSKEAWERVLQRAEHFREASKEKIKDRALEAFLLLLKLVRLEIHGEENLENAKKEAVIFAFGPHCGHPDSLLVFGALPKEVREKTYFATAEDYWYQGRGDKVRVFLNTIGFNTFPMSRSGAKAITQSLESATEILNSGFHVAIAPEGTRTLHSLEKRRFKEGVAELALITGKPVIPIFLSGHEDLMPKGTNFPRFLKGDGGVQRKLVKVFFGEPMVFKPEENEGTWDQKRKGATSQLRDWFLQMSNLVETMSPI